MNLFSVIVSSLMIVGGSFAMLIGGSYIVYRIRKKQ